MVRKTKNVSFYYSAKPRKAKKSRVVINEGTAIYKRISARPVRFKLRASFGVTSDGGGAIAGIWNNDPTGYGDWTNVQNMYDSYKIYAIKLHYIPSLPNDTSTVTGFWPLYVATDQNDATVPGAVSVMLQYDDMKVFNMYRPWKLFRRLRDQSAISGTTMLVGGYRPTTIVTASAGIKYYGNGFDLSTSYGQIIVTLYIKARYRQ